jgi:hypothetical protein
MGRGSGRRSMDLIYIVWCSREDVIISSFMTTKRKRLNWGNPAVNFRWHWAMEMNETDEK